MYWFEPSSPNNINKSVAFATLLFLHYLKFKPRFPIYEITDYNDTVDYFYDMREEI